MKVKIIFLISILGIQSLYSQLGFDGGFENSTLWNNGWSYSTSLRNGSTPIFGSIFQGSSFPINTNTFYSEYIINASTLSGTNSSAVSEYKIESNSLLLTFSAHSGNKCMRLGRYADIVNTGIGAVRVQEKMFRSYNVNLNNCFLSFWVTTGGTLCANNDPWGPFLSIKANNTLVPINVNGYTNNPIFPSDIPGNITGWTKVNVDLSQSIGQTVNLEFLNSDCNWGVHGNYTLLDDFEASGIWHGDIGFSPFNYCSVDGWYQRPRDNNGNSIGSLNTINIVPMKNGAPALGIPPFIIPSQYINYSTETFSVPTQVLRDFFGTGFNDYDLDVEVVYNVLGTTTYRSNYKTELNPGIDNDISYKEGSSNINYFSSSSYDCSFFILAEPPVLNGMKGVRTSWALRAYKNGVPITGSPILDPVPFIPPTFPPTFIKVPVISIAFLNTFWKAYKDYDIVSEVTYTLCGKTYTYKTDVNGVVAGKNNDIVDPKYKAETLTTNSDNCTTTTTITYPTVLPYSTFENKCKIDRKDFGVLNYKFDGVNGFTNYPASIGMGYNYMTKNTTFDCDNDILTHEIQYKCMGCKDEYIAKMTVATKCVITLCDQFECKPAAGSLLNPYLSNVKGNVQAKGQYVFNTKRVSFSASQSLKNSSYYSEFEPFYSNASNKWNKSTHTSWISTATVENISKYGQSVETKNPLSIYSVMKYGFGQSLPIISANDARYHEVAFFSFEDKDYEQTNNTGFKFDRDYFPLTSTANQNPDVYKVGNAENAAVVKDEAHTGKYSYYIQPKNNSSAAYTAKFIELCCPETDNSNLFKENYYIDVAGAKANDKSYSAEFQPERGKKYLITYWTKSKPSSNIGEQGYIDVKFDCDINYTSSDVKSNQVKQVEIEGWSLMSKEIEIPKDAKIMKFVFNPCSTGSYFDDIRFSPINTVMKSYVYNPKILKHVAELDENNYATFFDYDEMGNLVRIRKETERGIMTIKEGRSNLKDN